MADEEPRPGEAGQGEARTGGEATPGGEAAPGGEALAGGAPRPGGPRRPRSPRRPLIILGAVVGAGLLALGIYLLLTRNEVSTDDAQVGADMVEISPQVSGRISRVAVRANDNVKAGQLLVEIDDAEYAARLRQATAELQIARAQAEAADAEVRIVQASSTGGLRSARAAVSESSLGVTGAQAQAAAARAALERAQAEEQRTQADYQRAQTLARRDVIAQATLDQRRAAYESARAAVSQSRAQLEAAQEESRAAESRVNVATGRLRQATPIQAQIEAAQAKAQLAHAQVDAAQAGLALAQQQLSYTKVYAPRAGVASKLTARVGELVQPGQPLLELVPHESYVVANFKETSIGRMRPGQRATVKVDAFSGRKLQARVLSLAGGTGSSFALLPPDNASGNFVKVVQRVPVRLGWVNPPPDLPLRAGLSVEVTVYLE